MRGAYFVPPNEWEAAAAAGVGIAHWGARHIQPDLDAAWFSTRTGRVVMTYPEDEPDLRGVSPADVKARNEQTRQPGVPTFTVIARNYAVYRDVADELGVDIYPYICWFPWSFWNAFNWFTLWQGRRQLRRAAAAWKGKRWWGVIQAHSDGYLAVPSLKQFKYWERLYLEAGAVGVMAFAWGDGGLSLWKATPALIRKAWGPR